MTPMMKPTTNSSMRILLILLLLACPKVARAQNYTLSPPPFLIALDNSGKIINNACIWTTIAGTSTPATTYSDNAGTPNLNPIRSDSAGRFTAYLIAGSSYKFQYEGSCTPPAHGTTLRTADNVAGTPASAATVDATCTAGETISAGFAVYVSNGSGGKTPGQCYKGDSANGYSSSTATVFGIAPAAITSGTAGTVRIVGSVTGLSSLTPGTDYYIGTSGALTSTAPANARKLGTADTTSSIILSLPPNSLPGLTTTPTDGQLLIGKTSINGYALATLTGGTGLTVTNGSGTITLSPSVTLLDKSTTEQIITNTTTPTSVYSFSVPGGTLSTNKTLRFTLTGYYNNTSGGNSTLAVTGVYGATTFAGPASFTNFGNATVGPVTLVILLNANGATNSQRAVTTVQMVPSTTTVAAAVFTATMQSAQAFHDALAEDSTAAKTFTITITHGTANAAITFKAWVRLLEIIG